MKIEELSSVRDAYDHWAGIYDTDGNPLVALEEPQLKVAAGAVHDLAVLDLGCGTGRHATWLAAAGAKVTAIDFSEGMLAQARRKPEARNIRFVLHDCAETLPFLDSSFDIVVSALVLEHISDLKHFFREMRRVTRAGGRAVVSAMHPAMFLRGSQARFTDPLSGQIIMPGSVNHSLSDFVMAALDAGFSIKDMREYAPDTALAASCRRAEKYMGWPMLVIFQLQA